MRNVTSVPADELLRLQRSWKYVHPMVLSGREAPVEESKLIAGEGPNENGSSESLSQKAVSRVSSSTVDAARERFLQRKRGK